MQSRRIMFLVTALNVALGAGLWLGVLGATPGGAGPVPQDVVRASEFQLVNDDGAVVAQLYLGEDGSGNVRLRDTSGTVRVKLGVDVDGSGLILFDGEDDPEPGVWAASDDKGTRITLAEDGEKDRVLKP